MRALEDRPVLSDWQLLIFQSFNTIARDRQIGMAAGPIPWTAIDRFVQSRIDRGFIDPDEAADMETLIIALDDASLAHAAKARRDPKQKGDQADDDSSEA